MFEKFERRGWLYWIVLIYMSLETAYYFYSRLPPLVDLLGPNGGALWDNTSDFHQKILIWSWISSFVAVIFVAYFANGVKFAYYLSILIALLFLPYGVIQYHLMPDLALLSDRDASRAVGGFVGALLGGLLQVSLLVWATRRICFRTSQAQSPSSEEQDRTSV